VTGPGAKPRIAAATESLAALERQAAVLRAEITALRSTLLELREPKAGDRNADLVEANEQLVLASLHALTVADDAERRRDQAALASQRDALTGIPTRTLVLDRLHRALVAAQRRGTQLAVLFIDIDAFKQINDTFGHPVGDRVLQCVARRLESGVRETDTVARFGGEEFVVLLDDLASTACVTNMVVHLLALLSEPEAIEGQMVQLSASLGIALYPDDATDVASLIACSDAAMYRAKRRGPGGYEFCHNADRNPDGSMVMTAAIDRMEMQRAKRCDDRARHDALQEANGNPIVSALQAQSQESIAREAQRRQVHSMAKAAHELRNPPAPIRIATGMLDHSRDDLAQFTLLQEIIEGQGVVHTSRLVDDLLEGSRASTGKLSLKRALTDIRHVLDAAVLTCRPAIDGRQQQLEVHLPDPGAVQLHADRTRLVQIFTNLLDNTSKYTLERGRITLAVLTSDTTVRISVADNGIGIPPDALPFVFDLFVQDPRAIALHKGGLGIGLAIVRELVEAHGGTVTASSRGKERGSEFVVVLPRIMSPAARPRR
jgi:diguanylate cyclase (GGDEF)-like protein